MRELTIKLSKNTLFQTSLDSRVCLVRKGVERDVLMCQRQTGKIPLHKP